MERFGAFQVDMGSYMLFWVVLGHFVVLQAVSKTFEPT